MTIRKLNEHNSHILKTIADRFPDCKIWLFGSFAWGDPRQDSDIDLMIEAPNSLRFAMLEETLEESDITRNMDILYENMLNNENLKRKVIEQGEQI